MHVWEMIERIHASLQLKLARQGMAADREMLEGLCMAIACLVRDPGSLQLHSSPMPAEDYAVVAESFELAEQVYAEEMATLRALIARLETEESLQQWVQAEVHAGRLAPEQAAHAIREMVLAQFIDPDAMQGDDSR
ncbi:MAG: hypothetical protein HYZ81_14130 [Nitrospinae bacterium]|nr:hypothetical protein [Nitrospinota bacterium]